MKKTETIYFAAGCFWGIEEALKMHEGVVKTTVGYMGGHTENPSYKQVCSGDTGHAETVKVEYDPQATSVEQLLELFWKVHDPTQINKQGPDVGAQYRSVIFYTTEEQKEAAKHSKEEKGKEYEKEIATSIEKAPTFWEAEEYHQDYANKHGGGFCHVPLE